MASGRKDSPHGVYFISSFLYVLLDRPQNRKYPFKIQIHRIENTLLKISRLSVETIPMTFSWEDER